MNIKKDINLDYQNYINNLNKRTTYQSHNYSDENGSFNPFDEYKYSPENQVRKKRIRLLLAFLMLALFILGGYFYWVSKVIDKIQQPSILMTTPKVSLRFATIHLANYQAILLYKKIQQVNFKVYLLLKKEALLKRLQKLKIRFIY